MKKRIFLALELPKDVRRKLKKYFNKSLPVRWVNPENLHVTLNFLGEIDDLQLAQVLEIVQTVSGRHPQTEITLEKIIPFKYMIWAQVKNNPELQSLYEDLNQEFTAANIGRRQHQSYRPHINLARANQDTVSIQPEIALSNLRFSAKDVVVFQSILKADGPEYISLDAFALLSK